MNAREAHAQLVAGCMREEKHEVEQAAAYYGLSTADAIRLAALRWARDCKREEAADAA